MGPIFLPRFLLTIILFVGMIVPLAGLTPVGPGVTVALAQAQEAAAFEKGDWLYLAPPYENPRKLVKGRNPALSPDGKKLVYVQDAREGGSGLLELDLATGKSITLVPSSNVRVDVPSWSPQGDMLAFIKDMKEVVIIKGDGSGRRKIFSVPGGSYVPPAWSITGKSLLVNDLDNIFQIDLEGKVLAKTRLIVFTGKKEAVSSTDRFVPNPRNPKFFAFTMMVEGTPQFTKTFGEPLSALFLYDAGTRQRTRLTPPDMVASSPTWSGDGNSIYFTGYREPHYREKEPFRIYRINRDGSGLTMLTKGQNPSIAKESALKTPPQQSPPSGKAEPAPSSPKGSEALPPPPPMPD